jgi:hypothetical protein
VTENSERGLVIKNAPRASPGPRADISIVQSYRFIGLAASWLLGAAKSSLVIHRRMNKLQTNTIDAGLSVQSLTRVGGKSGG